MGGIGFVLVSRRLDCAFFLWLCDMVESLRRTSATRGEGARTGGLDRAGSAIVWVLGSIVD